MHSRSYSNQSVAYMYRASYSKNGVDAVDADDTAVPRLQGGCMHRVLSEKFKINITSCESL